MTCNAVRGQITHSVEEAAELHLALAESWADRIVQVARVVVDCL